MEAKPDDSNDETDDVVPVGSQSESNDMLDSAETLTGTSGTDIPVVEKTQLLDNLALFYLRLQSKYLLPATTIQIIVDEMQTVHDLDQALTFRHLAEKLISLGISHSETSTLLADLRSSDVFRHYNQGVLRSHHTRQTFYKNRFKHVQPVPNHLGQDTRRKACYAQYVSIKDSLKAMFSDVSVQQMYKKMHERIAEEGILSDLCDGCSFKSNEFFISNLSALRIILYQDSFEVANPLGSGKKKHKVLAVYFSLGDLPSYTRSSVDQIQLVLLCREVDFKCFGQKSVFSPLVRDLCDLEENGINLFDDVLVKGTVVAIVGDNLGSHCIGGFSENFSTSEYICRYCCIDRGSMQSDSQCISKLRTPAMYDESAANVEMHGGTSHGIKFRSVFNTLKNFHVCQPGLPPCLGHDLFEGVVARDLALCLRYFVKTAKFFSYNQLNRRISLFRYIGSDADNKPCEVKDGGDKLGGHAVQNWYFLRLLPLLIGDQISDKSNTIWRLLLLLRNVVELVCAPKITENQVSWMKEIICEYLYMRRISFPDNPMTPKHHYLMHYGDLTLQFGPLVRVWTMRFESKHSYFKSCARKLRNFRNLCQMLADRHQMLQAFLSAGSLFPSQLAVDGAIDFCAELYCSKIQQAVASFSFTPVSTVSATKATYKGTHYKSGLFVVLKETDDGFVFGKILLLLIFNGCTLFSWFRSICHSAVWIWGLSV